MPEPDNAQHRSSWAWGPGQGWVVLLGRPPSPGPAGLAALSLVILPMHDLDSRPSCPLWPHQSLDPQPVPESAHRTSPHPDLHSQKDPHVPKSIHEAHIPQGPSVLSLSLGGPHSHRPSGLTSSSPILLPYPMGTTHCWKLPELLPEGQEQAGQ